MTVFKQVGVIYMELTQFDDSSYTLRLPTIATYEPIGYLQSVGNDMFCPQICSVVELNASVLIDILLWMFILSCLFFVFVFIFARFCYQTLSQFTSDIPLKLTESQHFKNCYEINIRYTRKGNYVSTMHVSNADN